MTDRRVTAAIEHWAARFVANGVDPADFARVTAGIASWDGWCAAWCSAGAEHEDLGRRALGDGRLLSGGRPPRAGGRLLPLREVPVRPGPRAAARGARRGGALPERRAAAPAPAGRAGRDPVRRLGAGGDPAPSRRARPAPGGGADPRPGLGQGGVPPTEQLFLDRGLATFSVDGPGQGEAEYDLAIRPDWEVPGAAILDAVSALPGLDPGRIGVWGVSLGGYYAPRLASGDGRARACIALSGPFSFGEGWDQLPELTREAFRVRSKSATDGQARLRAGELTLAGRAGRLDGAAAGRGRPPGPDRALAAGPAAGRRGGGPGRAAAARPGRPRLRQRVLPAPALRRRLDGPPAQPLTRARAVEPRMTSSGAR